MKFGQQISQTQKQAQKLVMTTQLQQSIQMLQFNTVDLFSFLEQKALENPLIEVELPLETASISTTKSNQTNSAGEVDWVNQIPDRDDSLFDFLIQQIHLNYRQTDLRDLALFLIEYLDSNGYLSISVEDAVRLSQTNETKLLDALRLIQILEPAGVGARSLQECLLLQIERDETSPNLAYLIIEEYFDEFANRKWEKIAKAYQISLSDVQIVFDYVQHLSPFPGAHFSKTDEQFIIPDLLVTIQADQLSLRRTKEAQPRLAFQKHYFEQMKQADDHEVKKYLKDRKEEYEWLHKSLLQRGDTILKIGEAILRHQQNFFFDTKRPLVPLQMKQIAKEVGVHESTVSRSVNGKYLQCPFGVYELKSFFPTGMKQPAHSDEEIATAEIKREIMKIIENENKRKPLSDQKIVEQLKENSFNLSRRTVAKYREALGIASSAKRKRYDEN